MIRNSILTLVLAGALAFGGTGFVHAQERGMDMMNNLGGMADCPMMRSMARGPRAALEHADELALTPDQVGQLEALRDSGADVRTENVDAMREIHQQIEALTSAESFDEAAARATFDRMGSLHGAMAFAAARAASDVRSVLTPDQREALAELSSHARGMMHGMEGMGGMMPMMEMMRHCPMMGGGGI